MEAAAGRQRRFCEEEHRREGDENIPSSLPFCSIDGVAVQDKPNEVRIGRMTRARAKLVGQQVNSLN